MRDLETCKSGTIRPLIIGNLKAEIPVVQGGMGVGISLANLAGAVAREGGIGIISAAQIGFREDDFERHPLEANLRVIPSELKKAREIAPEGIIGFNIMVATNNYEDQVRAAVSAGADIIISGAGLPTDLPEYTAGSSVKIAPIVSGVKAAKLILKGWDRRYGRTADMVVIEGPRAGGHLGFKRDELDGYLDSGDYDRVIREIVEVVAEYADKYHMDIPVIVAGGIRNRDDVEHAISLGASGVQVATRFVTTEECDADKAYKRAYIDADESDIVIVQSPVGMPGRAIKNRFMAEVMAGRRYPPVKCMQCLRKCNPAEIPYCITERLIYAAEGRTEDALLFCGADAYLETEITTVRDVIESLIY